MGPDNIQPINLFLAAWESFHVVTGGFGLGETWRVEYDGGVVFCDTLDDAEAARDLMVANLFVTLRAEERAR